MSLQRGIAAGGAGLLLGSCRVQVNMPASLINSEYTMIAGAVLKDGASIDRSTDDDTIVKLELVQ
jgi:hypothetical protein